MSLSADDIHTKSQRIYPAKSLSSISVHWIMLPKHENTRKFRPQKEVLFRREIHRRWRMSKNLEYHIVHVLWVFHANFTDFANYFIQKVLYYLNDEQIEYILTIISPEFFGICCDNHGSRVIQSLMNFLQMEKSRKLFYQIMKIIQ